jgi:hypothetical protein
MNTQRCWPKDKLIEERVSREKKRQNLNQNSKEPFILRHPVKVSLVITG